MVKRFVLSVAVMIFMAGLAHVEASSLTVYGTLDCSSKKSLTISSCGCSGIPLDYHKGYQFTYTGQSAQAYDDDKCQKSAGVSFSGNAQNCKFFSWKSIFIECPSPPPPPTTTPPPPPPPTTTPPPPPPPTSTPPPPPPPTSSPPPPPPTATPPPPPPPTSAPPPPPPTVTQPPPPPPRRRNPPPPPSFE